MLERSTLFPLFRCIKITYGMIKRRPCGSSYQTQTWNALQVHLSVLLSLSYHIGVLHHVKYSIRPFAATTSSHSKLIIKPLLALYTLVKSNQTSLLLGLFTQHTNKESQFHIQGIPGPIPVPQPGLENTNQSTTYIKTHKYTVPTNSSNKGQ